MSHFGGNRFTGGSATATGDIEGVTAGSGLTGGGASGTVSLAVDHATATPSSPGTAAVGTATKSAREDHVHAPLVRKVVAFCLSSAPANTTTTANRQTGNSNYPEFVCHRACTLTGISAVTNSNPAGSTMVIKVKKNGGAADDTLTLSVTAGTTRNFSTTGTGLSFAANDRLQACAVTDASWTSTSLIAEIDLELTETA